MELTDNKIFIILGIGAVVLFFATWIIFSSLKNKIAAKKSTIAPIFGIIILIILWAAIIYGSINPVQTGGYLKEVLRLTGSEPEKAGDIGMDNKGRQLMCKWLNNELKDIDNFRIVCAGDFSEQIIFYTKKLPFSPFMNLKFQKMTRHMQGPLTDLFKGIQAWRLKGGREITPINVIKERLEILGAKTVGDFYASCGFEKYIIKYETDDSSIIEMIFSNKHYGSNPVKTVSK